MYIPCISTGPGPMQIYARYMCICMCAFVCVGRCVCIYKYAYYSMYIKVYLYYRINLESKSSSGPLKSNRSDWIEISPVNVYEATQLCMEHNLHSDAAALPQQSAPEGSLELC